MINKTSAFQRLRLLGNNLGGLRAPFFLCAGHVQQLEVKVLTQPDDGEV